MSIWYREGDVSITNGSTTVTGYLTGWINQVREGDAFSADGSHWYEVASTPTSNTELTLATPFLQTTVSHSTYQIQRTSPKWTLAADLALQVAAILDSSTHILSGTTNPADTLGADGDYYVRSDTLVMFGPKANGAWGAGFAISGASYSYASQAEAEAFTDALKIMTSLRVGQAIDKKLQNAIRFDVGATQQPTKDDDSADGYSVMSTVYDQNTMLRWFAHKVDAGAALWIPDKLPYLSNKRYAFDKVITANATPSTGTQYFQRLRLRARVPIIGLSYRQISASGDGTFKVFMSVYKMDMTRGSSRYGLPTGTPVLVITGEQSTNVAAEVIGTTIGTLDAGEYWGCIHFNGNPNTCACIAQTNSAYGFEHGIDSAVAGGLITGLQRSASYTTSPGDLSSATFTEVTSAAIPLMWFRT